MELETFKDRYKVMDNFLSHAMKLNFVLDHETKKRVLRRID